MTEIRQLRYFLAVADELHVRRAAERLHISQPPLTRSIQQLEAEIGTPLFHRVRKRLSLTEAGAQLRQDARRLMSELDQSMARVRDVGLGRQGHLRIGFVSTALYGSLPGLIRSFRESHPRVALELLEMTAKDQLCAFENGLIDLGFQVGAEMLGHTRAIPIDHDVLIACLPEQDPMTKIALNRPLPLRKLEHLPIVMFPRTLAPRLYDAIVGYADAVGITLSIEQEAVQMQTIIGLVSSGIGCAIVPGCMTALQRPGIVYRQLTPKSPAITTDLVWSTASSSPLVGVFREFVASGSAVGRQTKRQSKRTSS